MTQDHNQPGAISPPVGIAVLGTGITRIVSSLPAAAEVLHDHWPKERRGASWRAAVKACLVVHESKGSIAALRKALIAAASSANAIRRAIRDQNGATVVLVQQRCGSLGNLRRQYDNRHCASTCRDDRGTRPK